MAGLSSISPLRLKYFCCVYCRSRSHKTDGCWRTYAYIYGLIDPRDRLFHYVGRTIEADLDKRVLGHIRDAEIQWHGKSRGPARRKNDWLNKLAVSDLRPIPILIERVSVKDLTAERRWIQKLAHWGYPLTNLVDMPKHRRLP